ncbi:TPA: hypothetical protein O5K63_002765, partial [Staphylococcus aureus]|nr:hypothetical protein [Staphylococcus aureus]
GGAPTQRISKRNSTGNASWGGPQHRSWRKVSIQKCASWRGPNIEAGEKSAYKNVQVGVGHR